MAIQPTKTAFEMRNTEIAVLNEQIESLTIEKNKQNRPWGIFSKKKDTSTLDADIANLRQRRRPRGREKRKRNEREWSIRMRTLN